MHVEQVAPQFRILMESMLLAALYSLTCFPDFGRGQDIVAVQVHYSIWTMPHSGWKMQ